MELNDEALEGEDEQEEGGEWQCVPRTLTTLPQWVVWRWIYRHGRMTKMPYDAGTRKPASSTDPITWTAFDKAVEADQQYRYDGIGFVVARRNRLTGIDLDHCLAPETGAVEDWARLIVGMMDSYTEVTPSGTGLRIYVLGNLPDGGRRKGNLEMYDDARFFTVTGHHCLDTPAIIEEREATLHELHRQTFPPLAVEKRTEAIFGADDQTLLERAHRAKFSGEKFSHLWCGDYKAVNPTWSASEADLSLCRLLGFWTKNDPGRMDNLFRISGLMRQKWDEPHGRGRTYGDRTISKALGR